MTPDPGPSDPGSRHLGPIWDPDPGIWDPDPGIPASPAGRESWNPGQFCQRGRVGPPESWLFQEMDGNGQFRACPELGMS